MTVNVAITGAGGHLGGKLMDHLNADGRFAVTGLDLRPNGKSDVHAADLGAPGDWTRLLDGVEVLVHLAGDREPNASWDSSIRNNIDATPRLFHHAKAAGVRRIVFASSNWVQGGRRFGRDRLTPKLEPCPVNAYGVSKLFGERLGAHYAECHGMSVICLRIGWTQWTHDNLPGRHMSMAAWGQVMWLSTRDYLQGLTCAITAQEVGFEVLNLMSDNPGMRWDIERTKEVIGYAPQDGHRASVGPISRAKATMLWLAGCALPSLARPKLAEW